MAVEAQRLRIRRSLEEMLGVEEAAYPIEGRPAGGGEALVTKDSLDLRLTATAHGLRAEFRDQTTPPVEWFAPAVFAGISISSALIAGAFAASA